MIRPVHRFCLALVACFALARPAAAEAVMKAGDYVAIIGDSITEQKLYSLYMEDYLLMCQPARRPAGHAVRLGRRNVVGLCRPAWPTTCSAFIRPWPPPASA